MSDERMEPREGSEPEGAGFGKPWVPNPLATFLGEGAFVRSLVTSEPIPKRRGLVGMDVRGNWRNRDNEETVSIIVHPDVAEEWGNALIEAAEAARKDATHE
jgi:hypothetical protein